MCLTAETPRAQRMRIWLRHAVPTLGIFFDLPLRGIWRGAGVRIGLPFAAGGLPVQGSGWA